MRHPAPGTVGTSHTELQFPIGPLTVLGLCWAIVREPEVTRTAAVYRQCAEEENLTQKIIQWLATWGSACSETIGTGKSGEGWSKSGRIHGEGRSGG